MIQHLLYIRVIFVDARMLYLLRFSFTFASFLFLGKNRGSPKNGIRDDGLIYHAVPCYCTYSQSLTQAAFFDASNRLKKAQKQLSGPWPAYPSLYALCWKEPKSKIP